MDQRKPLVDRVLRWGIAAVLFPLCSGATLTLGRLLFGLPEAGEFWIPLVAGAGVWMIAYLLLPKPMWLYVVGHELTHALWAWLFGARVKAFKITRNGGHVIVSKTNWLITLAPYFFPIYAVVWGGLFGLLDTLFSNFMDKAWLLFGLGITYTFHLTLTGYVLRARQPDLRREGILFSITVIWLGNLIILLLATSLVTTPTGFVKAVAWTIEVSGKLLGGP